MHQPVLSDVIFEAPGPLGSLLAGLKAPQMGLLGGPFGGLPALRLVHTASLGFPLDRPTLCNITLPLTLLFVAAILPILALTAPAAGT